MSLQANRHIVVLTGAGISAESGIQTFRGNNGLWENYRLEDIARPEAWAAHPEKVLQFYNMRRRQLYQVEPNAGHRALAELEQTHRVSIITQNIDNLHERADSRTVLHLHGELDVARSTADPELLYPLEGKDIQLGDLCALGSQLRPHVVWFGEEVPAFETAASVVATADVLIVVGTSLVVYPAASLAYLAPDSAQLLTIDPDIPEGMESAGYTCMRQTAATGLPKMLKEWR